MKNPWIRTENQKSPWIPYQDWNENHYEWFFKDQNIQKFFFEPKERMIQKKDQKNERIGPWILKKNDSLILAHGYIIKKSFSDTSLWIYGGSINEFSSEISSLISGIFVFTQSDILRIITPKVFFLEKIFLEKTILLPSGHKSSYQYITQSTWWDVPEHKNHKKRMKHLNSKQK